MTDHYVGNGNPLTDEQMEHMIRLFLECSGDTAEEVDDVRKSY